MEITGVNATMVPSEYKDGLGECAVSPLNAISPHSTKFVKPMKTVIEEQTCLQNQAEEEEDFDDDEECLEEEGEDESNEGQKVGGVEYPEAGDQQMDLCKNMHQDGNDCSFLEEDREDATSGRKPSAAEENLSEDGGQANQFPTRTLNQAPGTPSLMSSGYGSQPFSGTPVSGSEDSISLHSSGGSDKAVSNNEASATTASTADISVIETKLSPNSNNKVNSEEERRAQLPEVNGNDHKANSTSLRASFAASPSKSPEVSESYSDLDTTCKSELTFSQDDNESLSSYGSRTDYVSVGGEQGLGGVGAGGHALPEWLVIGESIRISPDSKTGVVAFIGTTHFSSGVWVGVELDAPTGKNDGAVNGVSYFPCKPRFGIFVRPEKLKLDIRGRGLRATKPTTTPPSNFDPNLSSNQVLASSQSNQLNKSSSVAQRPAKRR